MDIQRFMIVEDTVLPERSSSYNTAICKNIPSLGFNYKARRFAIDSTIGIEGASVVEVYRYDAFDRLLDRVLPLCNVYSGRYSREGAAAFLRGLGMILRQRVRGEADE